MKFGDLILNHSASKNNPHRVFMFLRYSGDFIIGASEGGKKITHTRRGHKNYLTVIGTALKNTPWKAGPSIITICPYCEHQHAKPIPAKDRTKCTEDIFQGTKNPTAPPTDKPDILIPCQRCNEKFWIAWESDQQ